MNCLDEDYLRRWIGHEDVSSGMITPELAARFNATFDLPSPAAPAARDPAPLLIHWCLGQPAVLTGALGEDGHPEKGGFLPPVPLPRRMWAGGRVEFHRPLAVGETARRVSRIADMQFKQGRTGTLVFVTVDHEVEVEGLSAISERQDIVYREPPTTGTTPTPSPGTTSEPERSMPFRATPQLLFRYSALTFNAHRIHYDLPYARETESYPGLVVHGPLQATLLAQFATVIRNRPPSRITFRSSAPLFAGQCLLNACSTPAGIRLWTSGEDGIAATQLEAEWA